MCESTEVSREPQLYIDRMLDRKMYSVLVVAVAVMLSVHSASSGGVEESSSSKPIVKDHYPLAWVEIPYKNAIDNDRLFQKLKKCFLADQPKGCPQIATDLRRLAPEIIATHCGKCLPVHIERFKEIAEYLCHTRRSEFDEIRRLKDPDGVIQRAFESEFGKINC